MPVWLNEQFTDSDGVTIPTHNASWSTILRYAQGTPGTAKIKTNRAELIQNTNAGGVYERFAVAGGGIGLRYRTQFVTGASLSTDQTLAFAAQVTGVVDTSDYSINYEIAPIASGATTIISKVVNAVYTGAGVATSVALPNFTINTTYNVLIEQFIGTGSTLICRMKVWNNASTEPAAWTIQGTNTDITLAGDIAFQIWAPTAPVTGPDIEYITVENVGPVVAASNEKAGTTLSGGVAQNMPANISAGDLLLAFAVNDTPSTTEMTAGGAQGWTRVRSDVQGSNVVRTAVFAKLAAGGDALTLSGASQDYCSEIIRIPTAFHTVTSVSDATQLAFTLAQAATGNVDPGALTPGDTADRLWLAVAALDCTTASTISAVPAGYTLIGTHQKSASSTSSVALSVAAKNTAAATTENPGAFTNSSRDWIGYTVGVRGIATVSAVLAAPLGALTATATAVPKVLATLAAPLGSLTAAATAIPKVAAVLAAPLGSLVAAAAATVSAPGVSATMAAPLGALTATATATPKVLAVLAAPLGALVGTATATPTVTATLAAPLGALIAAASATPTVPAVLAAPLGALTAIAAATPSVVSTLDAPLGVLEAAATATVSTPTAEAVLDAPLGSLTATAAGVPSVVAAVAAPLGSLVAAATATPTVVTTLSAPLGALAATAVATTTVGAILAASLGSLTGTLAATPVVPGVLAASLGALTATAAASATHGAEATLDAALGSLTATAAATPTITAVAIANLDGLNATTTAGITVPATAVSSLGVLAAHLAASKVVAAAAAAATLGQLAAHLNATRINPSTFAALLGALVAHAIATRMRRGYVTVTDRSADATLTDRLLYPAPTLTTRSTTSTSSDRSGGIAVLERAAGLVLTNEGDGV